jgi:hypothetical protein
MLMTDAPGDFDAVNLVVTEIAIHRGLVDSLAANGTANSDGGREVLSDQPATYDVGGTKGTIVPDSTAAWVYVVSGSGTVAATMPALDGSFAVTLLQAGVYSVAIDVAPPLRDTTLAGVAVTAQNVTDLGPILLNQ